MMLTTEERAAMRNRHAPMDMGNDLKVCAVTTCYGIWPCERIQLLDDIDAAEAEAAKLRMALRAVEFPYECDTPDCRHCAICNGGPKRVLLHYDDCIVGEALKASFAR